MHPERPDPGGGRRQGPYHRRCLHRRLASSGLGAGPPGSPIQISRHATNHGHIATYNEGLAWAKGRYTALLSADDLFTPGALLRATHLLDAHPEVGFVTGKTITFRTDGVRSEPTTVSGNSRWQIRAGQDWFEERCSVAENNVAAPGVVVRTSLQRELGGYREISLILATRRCGCASPRALGGGEAPGRRGGVLQDPR